MDSEPLLRFKSHIEGRNSDVAVFADRLEWDQPKGWGSTKGKAIAGAATLGASFLVTGVRGRRSTGSEIIPIKSISSITTQRDGIRFSKVRVICSGNTIDFRVSHEDADRVKALITSLILGDRPVAPPSTSSGQADWPTGPPSSRSTWPQTAPPQSAAAPPPSPVAPPASTSVADELRKLAELRDAGVLSDEEFASQKAKLLG